MTQTKTRPALRSRKPAPTKRTTGAAAPDVLTLAEAAAYLRVPAADILGMVATNGRPGRQFGTEWRFFRAALQAWLAAPDKKRFWNIHFGALKDDPCLEEMLAEFYRQHGRPERESS